MGNTTFSMLATTANLLIQGHTLVEEISIIGQFKELIGPITVCVTEHKDDMHATCLKHNRRTVKRPRREAMGRLSCRSHLPELKVSLIPRLE